MIDKYTMAIYIFEEFLLWNSDLVKLMRNTEQSYDAENPLKFHLENDVWAHTCLCFNHLLNFHSDEDYDMDIWIAMVVSVLCHDIGKCYTKKVDDTKKKTTFYSHSFASIQDTVDFVYHLENSDVFDGSFIDIMNLVLPAVSNHNDLYRSPKRIELFFNNNKMLKLVSEVLANCDSKGSITHEFSKKKTGVDFECIDLKPCKEVKDNLRNVYIYNGTPASGKDYLAGIKSDLPVLSFDDVRVEEYKKHLLNTFGDNPIRVDKYVNAYTNSELYKLAWEWSVESKLDVWNCMKDRVNNIKGDYIITCAYSKKGRKRIINSFGKANYYCFYVVAETDMIFTRNESRNSKNLDNSIIKRFLKNQQIPTIREGFVHTEIICN